VSGTRIVAERLRATDLVAGLGPMERQAAMAILMRGPMERWEAGASGPVHAGSSGLLVVKTGHVEVVATTEDGRPLVLAEASDGEVLTCPPVGLESGEVVLHILANAWLCPLDHEHLRDLGRYPVVLTNLIEQCVRRTEEAQAAALRLAHRRVDDRVLLALRALAAREGRVTAEGLRLGPVLHRELARLANVTRPGATQALARLEREGHLVRTEDGGVLLPSEGERAGCRRPSRVPRSLARLLRG